MTYEYIYIHYNPLQLTNEEISIYIIRYPLFTMNSTQIILQKWILNIHRKPTIFYCLLRRGCCVFLGRMPPRGSDTGARGAGDPGGRDSGANQPP